MVLEALNIHAELEIERDIKAEIQATFAKDIWKSWQVFFPLSVMISSWAISVGGSAEILSGSRYFIVQIKDTMNASLQLQ